MWSTHSSGSGTGLRQSCLMTEADAAAARYSSKRARYFAGRKGEAAGYIGRRARKILLSRLAKPSSTLVDDATLSQILPCAFRRLLASISSFYRVAGH